MKARSKEVLDTGEISNRGTKESEFGALFINEKNSFGKMIEFFSDFNKTLLEEIQKEFKF
ncbi:hypothetical protein [Clostridium sp.]|uniref:hypothetical protein n=1 Tax=Clostridium sp. TaxID=1506 RepID=UPI003D6D2C4E